ncbi:hypothetical protein [Caulobacter phage BL198]|uniref:DUF1737 domain-containing protein n=1 Tax=Caulobacter phage BL198 TaxID=3020395 RepID=A0AAE9X277_9CAUD|nr:hypothetical protein [Caulobacter phage BL198]
MNHYILEEGIDITMVNSAINDLAEQGYKLVGPVQILARNGNIYYVATLGKPVELPTK